MHSGKIWHMTLTVQCYGCINRSQQQKTYLQAKLLLQLQYVSVSLVFSKNPMFPYHALTPVLLRTVKVLSVKDVSGYTKIQKYKDAQKNLCLDAIYHIRKNQHSINNKTFELNRHLPRI